MCHIKMREFTCHSAAAACGEPVSRMLCQVGLPVLDPPREGIGTGGREGIGGTPSFRHQIASRLFQWNFNGQKSLKQCSAAASQRHDIATLLTRPECPAGSAGLEHISNKSKQLESALIALWGPGGGPGGLSPAAAAAASCRHRAWVLCLYVWSLARPCWHAALLDKVLE